MIRCGVRDSDGLSSYYKARISQRRDDLGEIMITGYIGKETLISLAQLWNSPFEGDTAGNASGLEKLSSLGQTQTDITSTTLMNSRLVWEGAEPITFQLPLTFYAHSDAKIEVDDPIRYLMIMSSPELHEHSPLGQIPKLCTLDLGRRIKAPIVIRSVEHDTSANRTKEGYLTSNIVTLECSLRGAINASEINKYFL